jgi:preprotein translocase subunit SecB
MLAGAACGSGAAEERCRAPIFSGGAAREKTMSDRPTENGQAVPPAAAPDAQPQAQQLIINAQYIKDLSFENPRAPQSLRQQTTQPAVEINVDVKAQSLGAENYEVVLTIKSSAKIQEEALFLIELTYGAVITVRNVPQELLSAVVLVETPRLMFPFARNIVAETTRDGGFPPLMINPIDFSELLRRNAAQPPAGQPATPPPGGAVA